jgi:hypothetical protein
MVKKTKQISPNHHKKIKTKSKSQSRPKSPKNKIAKPKSHSRPKSPKNSITPNKHMNRALKLLSQITEVNKCVEKNCKKQKEEYENKNKDKNKKLHTILMEIAKKPSKKLMKEALKLRIDMMKTDEKRKVVECQLEKCYKQTKTVLQTTFDIFTDPSIPVPIKLRELGKKYKELFKKTITAQQVIKADIEALKIKK